MSSRPEDDLIAAELAIGLLDGAERDDAAARIDADPHLADERAWWQSAIALIGSDRQQRPGPHVWAAILHRLPAERGSLPGRRAWQVATAVATAAAAIMGVIAINSAHRPLPPPQVVQRAPQPPLVAILSGKGGNAGALTISVDLDNRRLLTAAAKLTTGRHSAELWIVPAQGKPVSLGVINADRPEWRLLPLSQLALLQPGATLAISLEPIGGSPTGSPTGAIILTGKLTDI